jgi:multisubunit Na+/H+ antiporter MnhB subunit
MTSTLSWWRGLVASGVLILAVLILWAVWSVASPGDGLRPLVSEHLEMSGVNNPVTAALLNFRSLDTMLEVVVLLAAMIGAWSLQVRQVEPLARAPGLLLERFTHWLVPVSVLVAGYLLWAGADATGGAFQAGAVLGAAGVLWILTHGQLSAPEHRQLLRVCFTFGVGVFLAVGLWTLAMGLAFLQYPQAWAKELILLIEAASTLTIAATLIGLFAGSQRGLEGELAPMEEEAP